MFLHCLQGDLFGVLGFRGFRVLEFRGLGFRVICLGCIGSGSLGVYGLEYPLIGEYGLNSKGLHMMI